MCTSTGTLMFLSEMPTDSHELISLSRVISCFPHNHICGATTMRYVWHDPTHQNWRLGVDSNHRWILNVGSCFAGKCIRPLCYPTIFKMQRLGIPRCSHAVSDNVAGQLGSYTLRHTTSRPTSFSDCINSECAF